MTTLFPPSTFLSPSKKSSIFPSALTGAISETQNRIFPWAVGEEEEEEIFKSMKRREGEEEAAEIDRLPADLLAHILALLTCFKDLAQASGVSRRWRQGVRNSLAVRERLSFSGWKVDDDSTTRLVLHAHSLKELDISRSRWGCQITDNGLCQLSMAKCISRLSSVSLWGTTGITDQGVVQLISRAVSLKHLNIGGTFITDTSLFAISDNCPHLKSIVLWGCRHVSERGLMALVNKCCKLESINVWGMRIPMDCFIALLTISPSLQILPKTTLPPTPTLLVS